MNETAAAEEVYTHAQTKTKIKRDKMTFDGMKETTKKRRKRTTLTMERFFFKNSVKNKFNLCICIFFAIMSYILQRSTYG